MDALQHQCPIQFVPSRLESALYQGTTSVVPQKPQMTRALAPAALFPSLLGSDSVRQLNLLAGHYLCSIQ
jgi:hypothetical protein